jgi:hypothetical protein
LVVRRSPFGFITWTTKLPDFGVCTMEFASGSV